MASKIEQDLVQIRTAIYGREVREAIADGIERCYQESTAQGQIDQIVEAGEEARQSLLQALIPDYASLTFPIEEGILCTHDGEIYASKVSISTSEPWDQNKWEQTALDAYIRENGGSKLTLFPEYESLTFPIAEGTLCDHDGALYYAKEEISTTEAWTPAKWQETTLLEYIQNDVADKADRVNPVISGSMSMGRTGELEVGTSSIAMGHSVGASGYASQAFGYLTVASGNESHADGLGTIANGRAQHAFGEYNAADSENKTVRGTYVEIVGNGTSDTARRNARTLDWAGNERVAGDVFVHAEANGSGGSRLYCEADLMTTEALTEMLNTVFGVA